MDTPNPPDTDDLELSETPEDVAVLYSWANIQGAKYRDFSASKREFRAKIRKRAAEAQREEDLKAKSEAEEAALAAERAAHEAEEAARFHEDEARKASAELREHDSQIEQQARARAIRHAEELSRRAAQERMEAARRAEAVAAAEAAARREAREMAEARASAERQAVRYAESESVRKARTGPQPTHAVHGVISDPEYGELPVAPLERVFAPPVLPSEDVRAGRLPRVHEERFIVPQPEESAEIRAENAFWKSLPPEQQTAPRQPHVELPSSPVNYYYEPDSEEKVAAVDQYAQFVRRAPELSPLRTPIPGITSPIEPVPSDAPEEDGFATAVPVRHEGYHPDESSGDVPSTAFSNLEIATEETGLPAWLNGSSVSSELAAVEHRPHPLAPSATDTLQQSRERVAARWYALKGILEQGMHETQPEAAQPRSNDSRIPLAAVFSISGGVGKTSIVATLGRALSSFGEKVLLVDTTLHGLLPFYFGASELQPGVVRSFSPPASSKDAPISLVSFDVLQKTGDQASLQWLGEELNRTGDEADRVLLDLSPASLWVLRRVVSMNTVVLVPLLPDMNSVISLAAIEKFFAGAPDAEGRPTQPFYLLNGFDSSLPLHLDVREVMQQKLGERMLPFVIRRSPAVAEALAEGMTVMDYAPEAVVASDYMSLAAWLRKQSSPVDSGLNTRWSEQ